MLINKHDCYSILFDMQNRGIDVQDELYEAIHSDITPKIVVKELIKQNNPVVQFYKNLNNKAHKVIKELLTCDGKPISNYIKIATSIITQGIITIEHIYKDSNDIDSQNNFIECLGLSDLSNGLHIYFSTGDSTKLVEAVHNNKMDVKSILD